MLRALSFLLLLASERCNAFDSEAELTASITDNVVQWQSDISHTGYVDVTLPTNSSGLPSTPTLHERFRGLNIGVHTAAKSSPIALGDTLLQAGDSGILYRVDIETGEVIWAAAQRTISSPGFHSTPCVVYRKEANPSLFGVKDLVIIGSYDGVLAAYDLETGHTVWENVADVGEHIGASPTCTQEAVYISVEFSFPEEGGGVCKIDVNTGKEIWCNYSMGSHSHSTAGVDLENKIVVSGSNDRHLHVFRESDGVKLAKYDCEGEIKGPILLHKGVAIFGGWSDHIYAIDLNDVYDDSDEDAIIVKTEPVHKWDPIKTGHGIMGGAALDPSTERIYIGSFDKKVRCIDFQSGEVLWVFQTGQFIQSSPVVVNNGVIIGSSDGKMYCLDKDNGNEYWSYLGSRTGRITSSAAVSSDGRYIMYASDTYGFTVTNQCQGKVGSLHVIKISGEDDVKEAKDADTKDVRDDDEINDDAVKEE